MRDPKARIQTDAAEARIEPSLDAALPKPNFFIVGAPKAGTTSLYAYLRHHPHVFMPERKEPHFFSRFRVDPAFDNFAPPVRDASDYQDLFRGSEGYVAVGEASSSYLSDKHAARRIKADVPDAKIIISLRNPVERAYSHFLMECREGREARPFRDALAADMARPEKGWGISAQYVELGLYAEQVQRYIELFGRRNVLVIFFEELTQDTRRVMADVAEFLGVDPELFPDSAFATVHNPFLVTRSPIVRRILRFRPLRVWSRRWIPRSLRRWARNNLLFKRTRKPGLDEDLKVELARMFEDDLQRLERVLGRDIEPLRRRY